MGREVIIKLATGVIEKAISDGGSTAHIISMVTANQLLLEGLIEKINPVQPGIMSVLFGKDGAGEAVIGEITTTGILRRILVVHNIAASLISEIALTQLGVILLKDNNILIGFLGDKIILRGYRNPDAPEGSIQQLWNVDLLALLKEDVLDTQMHYNLSVNNQKKPMYISLLSFSNRTFHSFSASPHYSQQQVRIARSLIRNLNNTSPYTIANTIENNAWADIPREITADLLRRIGDRRDNILHLLTTSHKDKPGGSGIRSNIVGETAHMDIQGKFKQDKGTHAEFVLIIVDEATLWARAYALTTKTSSKDAFLLYKLELNSYGKNCNKIRVDAASEVTNDFLRKINNQLEDKDKFHILVPFEKLGDNDSSGVQINKAAPEEYAKLFERFWQTLKARTANTILNQNSLTNDYWQWAVMDTAERSTGLINSSHPSMTPMERVTGIKPDFLQMTTFRYGALTIFPKVNKSNNLSETNYELGCVLVAPQLTKGSYLVLRQGTKVPVIRAGLKPILEHAVHRSKEEWEALQPIFDKNGRMTKFDSPVTTIFSLDELLRQYRGKQHEGPDVMTEVQKDALQAYKGRVKNNGDKKSTISLQSNKEETNRSMRSNVLQPLPEHKVREMMISSSAASPKESSIFETGITCVPTLTNDANGVIIAQGSNVSNVNVDDESTAREKDEEKDPVYWFANKAHINGNNSNLYYHKTQSSTFLNVDEVKRNEFSVFKARIIRTDANPSMSQIMRSEFLQKKWGPKVREFIDEGLHLGIHKFITPETVSQGGYKVIRHVNVFDTKRNGDLKYRLTPDGSQEPKSAFVQGSLTSAGIDSFTLHQLIAHGAARGSIFSTADVKGAYPNHNRWDDPECLNPRRICTEISAFQSGTGRKEYLEFLTCTNGFRDASAEFEGIYARAMFKWGGQRSAFCRSLYFRHYGKRGFMAVGVYVDDSLKIRSPNEEGAKMHQELADVLTKAGFDMKDSDLNTSENGIDFAGRLIKKFTNKYGTGIQLTQPSMHIQIEACLKEWGEVITDEITWLPISKNWSPLQAAQGIKSNMPRANTTDFLSLLGMLLWTSQTSPRSALPSILSSYSRNPGESEMECLVQASKHFLSTSGVPLMFYRNEKRIDTNKPDSQHGYVDAGETGETDGSGRKSIVIKLGLPGTHSGGIVIKTNKIKNSDSTPMDEAEALADSIGFLHITRGISEEFAGLRNNAYITDNKIDGSPDPTTVYVKQLTADAINSKETGDTDCVVRTKAMKHIQRPSVVFEDNEIVARIANSGGKIKVKGLRPALRLFAAIDRAKEDDIIDVVHLSSVNNISNHLSKLPSSPLAHILGLEGIIGKSDELDNLKEKAIKKFGKSSTVATVLAAMPAWTNFTHKGISYMFHKTGFTAALDKELNREENTEDVHIKNNYGIGYLTAVAAVTDKIQKEIDVIDYSDKYFKLQLPDPEATSTVETDAWDTLVRFNSNTNANSEETEYIERALAANKTMQIQIQTIDNKQQLEELEEMQRKLSENIARNKVISTISSNKRGIEHGVRDSQSRRQERRREEEKVIQHGVSFMAIGGSYEYVDNSEENTKRSRLNSGESEIISTQIQKGTEQETPLKAFATRVKKGLKSRNYERNKRKMERRIEANKI